MAGEQDYIQLLLKVSTEQARKLDTVISKLDRVGTAMGRLEKKSVRASTATRKLGKAAEETKGGFLGLGQSLGYTAKKVAMWTISTGMVYGTIRALKAGIDTISMVDSKMVDLQKVFVGTSGELKMLKADILDESIAMGSLVGTTIDAAIELGRMGKTRAEISTLMRTSLLAQNIAEMEAADATKYLNAAILQFNKIADDSITILDQWNQLSNQMPVRTIDFAEAVSTTGAVVQQAGGAIEDLNAWVATLSATMAKSGQEIGTALKTIVSYAYRPATRKKIKEILKIDVKDTAGGLMDINELLLRVAASWDTLRKSEQEELAQSIAGVRRKAFFLSLMENFDMVLEAHAKQWDAAGSAYRENEIRLSSLRTKVEQLGAAFQKLSVQGGDTGLLGLMKDIIDGLRELVVGFTEMNGALQLVATAGISAVMIGMSLLMRKGKALAFMAATTGTAMWSWIGIIAALGYGLYKLTQIAAGNIVKIREQRREVEESIEKIRIQKEEQKAIIDQFELYDQAFRAYEELKAKGKDATEAEKMLKKILQEIHDLNPLLVSSTDNYTEALKRLKEAAGKAETTIKELSFTQLNALERNINLELELGKIQRKRAAFEVVWAFRDIWAEGEEEIKKRAQFYEKEIESLEYSSNRINVLGHAIKYFENKLNELSVASGHIADEQTGALENYINLLKTQIGLEEKRLAIQQQRKDWYKAKPPEPGLLKPTLSELELIAKVREELEKLGDPFIKLEKQHALDMAKFFGNELNYYKQQLLIRESVKKNYEDVLNLSNKISATETNEILKAKEANNLEIQKLKNIIELLGFKEVEADLQKLIDKDEKKKEVDEEKRLDRYERASEREELRLKLVKAEIDGASALELITIERAEIEETITDEKEKQLLLDRLDTREQLLKLRIQQRWQRDITNAIENIAKGWAAGEAGAEIGAEFAEGIGEAIGTHLGTKLVETQIGKAIGGIFGNLLLPGVGGIVGGWLFGEIGKALFGWEKEARSEEIEALDENTRALRENTQAFQDFQERLINAPAGFFMPAAGSIGLPTFQREGVITQTGIANVDRGEIVIRPDTLQNWFEKMRTSEVTKGGTQQITNFSKDAINVIVNNPSSNIDVEKAVHSAMNKIYAEGMGRGEYVAIEH